MNSHFTQTLIASLVTLALFTTPLPAADSPTTAPARLQLRNLNEKPTQPRFTITDRVWPATPGQASVCLWADDKLAAYCFGVDDNWASEHDWWLEQQKKYGFPCTWFVITGRANTGGLWGKWDAWKKLLTAGNDIQSHTVTHLHADDPTYKGVEWDYTQAITQLEQNLPNHKVTVLAYPGGKNSNLNSRELAAKYYIAARGTTGMPNAVNKVDYLNVNATRLHVGDNPKATWADSRQLLDPKNKTYFRGWGFYFTHGVEKDKALAVMDYLKANEKDFWVGLFADQARYGQERDTAKLTVTKSSPTEIRLTLSDDMDDTLFTFPLTIKVRLADSWKTISATQAGKPLQTTIIQHDNAPYALLKAIPDQGEILLTPLPAEKPAK